jgi:hypothetical protein
MALSTTGKLVTLGAMTAGVVSLSYAASRAQRETKQRRAGSQEPPLEGVYALGTRLPERVAQDVQLPIEFTFSPRTMSLQGDIIEGPPSIATEAQLLNLVTDMTHERANIAYEYMLHLVGNKGMDLSDATTRDEAVRRTAAVTAPRVDWSKGLSPYAYDSPEGLVWRGIELLGELAHQSYWNKQAMA